MADWRWLLSSRALRLNRHAHNAGTQHTPVEQITFLQNLEHRAIGMLAGLSALTAIGNDYSYDDIYARQRFE